MRLSVLAPPGVSCRIAFSVSTIAACAALGVALLLAADASAAFVKIDDFQSLSVGQPVDGQGNWSAEAGQLFEPAGVATDPSDPNNKVLRVGQGNYAGGRLGHREVINTTSDLRIADGTTATLFFRARYGGGQMDFSVGMSDIANPISDTIFNSFTQFESQLAFTFAAGFDRLSMRDGGSLPLLTNQVSKDTWYNVWMVINNQTDTTRVYIQGGAFATQTLLSSNGKTDFGFRNSTGGPQSNDLITFFIATGRNTSSQPPNATEHVGPAFLDDIYLDTSGVNLVNPVPEPSTLTLGLICAAGLTVAAARRRMRG